MSLCSKRGSLQTSLAPTRLTPNEACSEPCSNKPCSDEQARSKQGSLQTRLASISLATKNLAPTRPKTKFWPAEDKPGERELREGGHSGTWFFTAVFSLRVGNRATPYCCCLKSQIYFFQYGALRYGALRHATSRCGVSRYNTSRCKTLRYGAPR